MASPGTRETKTNERGSGETIVLLTASAAAACLVALLLALVLGGAAVSRAVPGLPDPGTLTLWGLPIATTVMDVFAALTLGLLVLAAFLLPSAKGALGGQARSYVRAASWTALAWAAAAAGTLVFELSSILGRPAAELIGTEITSSIGSVPQGIGLMAVVLVAIGIALFGRTTDSAAGAAGLVALSLVGLVPAALTGHAASAPNHEMAMTGLAMHLLAASVWVGGLSALVFHALRADGEQVPTAVRRFSTMALWAWIGVAVSGVASAASRISTVQELFTTGYGQIMLAKTAIFLLLGGVGWAHRSRAVPKIAGTAGRAVFVRLAAVEVVLMAAAMGLAAALSRTATPVAPITSPDPFRLLTGFEVPPPLSVQTLLTLWRPDLFFSTVIVVLGGLYITGMTRLARRGDRWPWGRAAAWFAGLLTIGAVQLTGVATYAVTLFSVHMVQHMVLAMLTPILLVLGAPITLALRALKPAEQRGDRGPREWLTAFLNSRFSWFVTHPGFAAPLFVISMYALYFTPLFGALMLNHMGHMFMNTHFLLSGFLFYWIISGVDHAPRKVPYLIRIVLLLLVMGFHAFFGIAIMMQSAPLGMEYYGRFDVPWLSSLEDDQYAGGGVAWALGEIPTLLVLVALTVQWARDEERAERRRERHSRRDGSDDADMDAYNAYLASLERRSRQWEQRQKQE